MHFQIPLYSFLYKYVLDTAPQVLKIVQHYMQDSGSSFSLFAKCYSMQQLFRVSVKRKNVFHKADTVFFSWP